MKKLSASFLSILSAIFLLSSCAKEDMKPQAVSTNTVSNATTATGPKQFLGVYNVRDAKTIFIGQANPKSSNVLIHLDYLDVQKTMSLTADKKHFTMPYGPSNYVDSGWAYIIDYNAKTKEVSLAPNAAMIADIIPGSFETRFATYDPATQEGTFVTRFTTLSDVNGNEVEVSENLFR